MAITFDGARAFEHVRHLTVDIGARVIGTEGCKRAEEYIQSCYETWGLGVRTQSFPVQTSRLLDHRLEILEPELGEIPSRPYLMTPDTPEEGLTGELVFVEGLSEPQVGPHLEGKIVLWSTPGHVREHDNLLRHRPLAIIAIDPTVGVTPKRFQLHWVAKPYPHVPLFKITYEDGMRLMRVAARKARVFLRSDVFKSITANVVAEVTGSDHPDEIIVVGAHYDTQPDLPGATDNATGTAIVMELARLYAERGSKRTLRFAAWTGEEGGLLGSRHYVHALQKRDKRERQAEGFDERRDKTEFEQHLLNINFDVHGAILGHYCSSVIGPPEMDATFKVLTKELGIPLQMRDFKGGNDHVPFVLAGIPGITVNREGGHTAYMHTTEDALDLISARPLEEIGRFVDTFISRTAARAYVWPFDRQVPEGARKEREELVEKFVPLIEVDE